MCIVGCPHKAEQWVAGEVDTHIVSESRRESRLRLLRSEGVSARENRVATGFSLAILILIGCTSVKGAAEASPIEESSAPGPTSPASDLPEGPDPWFILPAIFYLPDYGTVLGGYVSYTGLLNEEDWIAAYAATTFGSDNMFSVEYQGSPLAKAKLGIQAWYRYENWQRNYFGNGNDSSTTQRQYYYPGKREVGLVLQRSLTEHLKAEVGAFFRQWKLVAQGKSDFSAEEEFRSHSLSWGLLYQRRNDALDPSAGVNWRLSYALSDIALGGDYDFGRLTFQSAWYRKWLTRGIVAFRFEADALVHGDPPFVELPTMGGNRLLRGASEGRYRGKWLGVAGVELRYRVHKVASLVTFLEAGRVAQKPQNLSLKRLHPTAGVGVRLKIPGAVMLRLDFAIARDEKPTYFVGLGHAF